MTDSVDNLVLEHLRAIRAVQDTHTERFARLESRMTNLESTEAGLRRDLAHMYGEIVEQHGHTDQLQEPPGCESNDWLQTLILDEAVADQRDAILMATTDAGLMTRPAWTLMHQLAPYQDCPRAPLPVAESLARRIINLPSSAGLVSLDDPRR